MKKGESSGTIARDMKISKRRVEQVWKYFSKMGEEPVLGKNLGRPKKPYDPKEAEVVKKAFDRFKFGARILETVIDGFYNIHISHNRNESIAYQQDTLIGMKLK